MPGIRWIIPFKIIVLPHSIQLLKLFCYPTDLSLNVNKMIIAYNSSKMFHPQELWWNVLWHDGLKAAFDVQMSGAISFPVTQRKHTNTGTKNVTRHVNHCPNGQHKKCWKVRKSHQQHSWFGNCDWQHNPAPLEAPGSPSAGFCNSNILTKTELLQMNVYEFPGAPALLSSW